MNSFSGFIWYALPILVFVLMVLLFSGLYRFAKKRTAVAFAVGVFLQMFLPDPKVQQTIEVVAEKKLPAKKATAEDKDKNNS